MKIRQLFFDLDRTLWDFETNSKFALSELFHLYQLEDAFEHFIQFHYHYSKINAELWHAYGDQKITKDELRYERFRKTLALKNIQDEQLVNKLSDGYVEISPKQTALFPGAIETLEELKKEDYRLHIITNGFKEVQDIKLENCGLKPYFDLILCSEEVGVNKPSRGIFNHALEYTHCKAAHAIMIGDDMKADIVGALNAGWSAIHFDPERKFAKEREVPRIRELAEIPDTICRIPIVES